MTDQGFPGISERRPDGEGERHPESRELLDRTRRGVPEARWALREWIRTVALEALRGWSLDAENAASDFADSCIRDNAKRLRKYDLDQGTLKGYLVKSVQRDARRLIDRRARESRAEPPSERIWDGLTENAVILRRYETFLKDISSEDRLIWNCILEGETQKYVAGLLMKPAGTVACRVSALKKKFRRLLNGDVT